MTHHTAQIGLFVALGTTVVVLFTTMWLGHKGQRRAHFTGVGTFLVSFLVTVFFAETLGTFYTFANPSFTIHLSLAVTTALGTAAPLFTGYRHWKGKGTRATHRAVVLVWLVGVVSALGTGAWMLSAGQLNAPPEASHSE